MEQVEQMMEGSEGILEQILQGERRERHHHEGELEIGQVSAQINSVKPVKQIVNDIIKEFREIQSHIASIKI